MAERSEQRSSQREVLTLERSSEVLTFIRGAGNFAHQRELAADLRECVGASQREAARMTSKSRARQRLRSRAAALRDDVMCVCAVLYVG